MTIDRQQYSDYVEVCGFSNTEELAATYPAVLALPLFMELMLSEEFPFALLGLVHVENSIIQYRTINLDEELQFRVYLGELGRHRKGWLVPLICEVRVNNELVWQTTMTNLVKTNANKEETAQQEKLSESTEADDSTQWQSITNLDLHSGLGRKYAKASTDYNPIHLHPLTAKLFGFKRHIIHGMWTAAKLLAEQQAALAGSFKFDVSFKKPIYLPSKVELSYALPEGGEFKGSNYKVCSENGSQLHLLANIQPID